MKTASFTSEIISIGDELATGALVDTNSAFLSRELSDLGIAVRCHTTVGDDLDAIAGLFRCALLRSDLVLVTGGLGPTEDDLTRQAAAQAVSAELVQNLGAMEHIRRLFAIRGRVMPESNRIQSFFPSGSKIIDNPHGTAPGFEMTVDRTRLGVPGQTGSSMLMTFPGVPAELREMWYGSARRRAEEWEYEQTGLRRHLCTRTLRCFGAGESDIESRLPHLIARDRSPRVGITAASGIISLRIFAQSSDPAQCRLQADETAQLIYDRLGSLVYGEEADTLASVVGRKLAETKRRAAVLEWGTRGFLAQTVPADVFAGGLVDSGTGSIFHTLQIPETSRLEDAVRKWQLLTGADAVLAVGAFPQGEEETLRAQFPVPVGVLLDKVYIEQSFPYGLHPSVIKPVFANRALNILRLKLLGEN